MEYVLENLVQVGATLLITLIGVFGTWLSLKIGKMEQLKNIDFAAQQLIEIVKIGVGELEQTTVHAMRDSDGKLSKTQIAQLRDTLVANTREKLAAPTIALLESAKIDVNAFIVGVGDDYIKQLKQNN